MPDTPLDEALLLKMDAAWRRLWTHLYRGETKLISLSSHGRPHGQHEEKR